VQNWMQRQSNINGPNAGKTPPATNPSGAFSWDQMPVHQ
jgi:hypothetical protein